MPAKTPYVRPDVANLLAMMAANPGPSFTDMSPAEGRAMYNAMGQMLELPRGEISSTDLALPGGVKARLYTPAALEDGRVVAYYHGGGWVIGDLDTHDPLCAEIARALGRRVLSVDYRLAPEARFPAAAEDCLAATRWLAGSPAGVLTFGEEKLIYYREAAAGHNALAYYLGKTAATLYRIVVGSLHFSGVFVLLARPTSSFATLFVIILGMFFCVYGLAAVVSMLVKREQAALLSVITTLIVSARLRRLAGAGAAAAR
jgi:hypothetical protein